MNNDENTSFSNNRMVLYRDENGQTNVSVLFSDEDFWLTQPQLAELYNTTQQNISQHIDGIYRDGELEQIATNKKFLLVRLEGGRQVKRQIDHYIAKNYLSEKELTRLNLLVAQYLDHAEFQALEQNPMTMQEWIATLDRQIIYLQRKLLEGTGKISHAQAIEKAEREFEIYRMNEMRRLESDFDKAVKQLAQQQKCEE